MRMIEGFEINTCMPLREPIGADADPRALRKRDEDSCASTYARGPRPLHRPVGYAKNGPKYAHPRFVEIISDREMPLNGAGKIDRNLARAQLAAKASAILP